MSVAPDRVCVVIGRTRHKMMQVELREAVKRGAKFIEVRLDFIAKAVSFQRLEPYKGCPWVATIRRPQDGGRWSGTDAERQMIIRQAIVSGTFDWIDLEHDVAGSIPRFGATKRIVSYHNMTETPNNIADIYADMLKIDADVYKIAVMAQNPRDNWKILEIQRDAKKPTIAFCMGEMGFPSRIISLKYGAPWIYAAFNKERDIAPGMPTLDDFKTTYNVRTMNADTKIYGLLGDPVAHSYSPILHNHMFGRLSQNAIYLPFRVPKDQFEEGIRSFEQVPVSGYSVTIPHKEAAAAVAKKTEQNVQTAGAANTLVLHEHGEFFAANTDFTAAVDSLKAHLAERAPAGVPPQEINTLFVLILGAGGAARAVAHGLHKEGAAITIAARTHDRAAALAAEVGCKYVEWEARHSVSLCDVLINCTPVGMHPKMDESPMHASFLKPGLIVFDTVYNPENTLLIRDAKERGCNVIPGTDMFVRQAALQFELFTGITPPIDKMRDLLRRAMSPLTRALNEDEEEDDDDDSESRPMPE